MSRAEQYAWGSLTGLAAVFWWFQMRMLDGLKIVDQPAGELLGIYLGVLIASAVIEIVLASIFAGRGAGGIEKDERDIAIDRRASLNERMFIIVAVNILIWQALMEGAFAGHAMPKIDVTNLPTLFFALFSVLFGGEMVKRVSTILLYRFQTVHG